MYNIYDVAATSFLLSLTCDYTHPPHSFYPRPSSGSSSSSGHSSSSSFSSSSHHHPSTTSTGSQISSKPHAPSQKSSIGSHSPQQLDIAKALLDLPQSRSPARGGGAYSSSTSSQKSSPSKSRSPATTKKKMSSSSPGEREGYYPCNRCGRYGVRCFCVCAHLV